jgi:hypothetical protein
MNDTLETKVHGSGMSEGHVLDLKLPIGWLLSAYGVLLTVYGLLTKKEMYAISLGINLNLVWGILMLAIGGAFLLTAFLKNKKKDGRTAGR